MAMRVTWLGALALVAACSKHAPEAETHEKAPPAADVAPHAIPRPAEAVASFAVLTGAVPAELEARTRRDALAQSIQRGTCGDDAGCHAVHALVRDETAFSIDVRGAAEWGLPAGDALAEMGASLTPGERASIPTLARVVVVRARSEVGRGAVAARTAWAATSALAGALHGLVYDETEHRIEDAAAFASHAITEALGDSVWREDRIAVQLYEAPDGTARLLTLGMRRFGAPDLEIEGAPMNAGRPLGALLNLVAAKLVDGASTAPLALPAPDAHATPDVDLVSAPHHEGDPEGTVLRVLPVGGDYDALVARVLGKVDGVSLTNESDSPALSAIAARARAALPGAIDRWSRARDAGATLLVKLPFGVTAPDGTVHDGGALEWMWVNVSDANADTGTVSGTLANTPVYVAQLQSGSRVTGRQGDVADYVLDDGHGAKEGGDSIRALAPARQPEGRRRPDK
jgi:uncharacterized protein YegJ (DUF2314 family)